MPSSSPFPALASSLLLTALAALGCGADPGIMAPPPPPDPSVAVAPAPRSTVTLQVAGGGTDQASPLPPFDCTRGTSLSIGGRRYCLYPSPTTWASAESRCQEHGGHLATVQSPAEESALLETLGNSAGPPRLWIGLAEPSEGRWLWSNAAPVSFSAWNAGEPNNAGGSENCGEWLFPGGRWNDLDCGLTEPFLCEAKLASPKARPPACNGRSFTIGSSAYCFHADEQLTWEKAQQRCSAQGGTLAVIESAEENQAIAVALGARPVQVVGSVWLGLNDRAQEGSFVWSSGEPVTHRAFRAGEPNNSGDEDCVEWSPTDGKWNDLSCSASLASLCEAPSASAAAPAASVADGTVSWQGMSEDRVGERNSFVPNGKPDGHFRLTLSRSGELRSIAVSTVNAFGNPQGGQLWHTADPANWVIGVVVDGWMLTRALGMPVGVVQTGEQLDLFCSDSGWFKPGQRFAIELTFSDGQSEKRIVQLPAQRSW